ncbi:filamentous hemagglutinin N-terminal domain-containing protein [Calothrix sp. PCC 6303]|uniref:two-partner secretion domain-containing protein n=1 Tax=Calothrix sp. PCC 6303 TaxID=1170562 RepID=UPI0002E810B4|nr:filamentous hemagglutinin N-terminal domain-containing protein [Calothrix sp. PCC 6303]
MKLFLSSTFFCNFILFNSIAAQAQIIPDSTLGNESSQVNPNVLIKGANADQINGGATRGSNLFHSFSEFNISDGQRVYFANPSGVLNILTRVTGNNSSSIFGTLGVDGNANLFLMNPNGILFGANAKLDVQGSFVGTTANGVLFGNQQLFSTTNPQAPSLLVVSVPLGLQYGNNPEAIQVQGASLQVPNGQTLTLAGGTVNVDGGQLLAPGGRVELGAVSASGTVSLNSDRSLSFPDNVARDDVAIRNDAIVNVRAGGGGSIAITARNFTGTGAGTRLRAGIATDSGSVNAQAGDIDINTTGAINLDESTVENIVGDIGNVGGIGNAGDINITASNVSLTNGAYFDTTIYGQGNAGNIAITAKDAVSFDGKGTYESGAYSWVNTGAIGKGGDISITSGSLELTNGARLSASTFGKGNAGSVKITATDAVSLTGNASIFSAVEAGGVGEGGNIDIDAASLSLTDGAQLLTITRGASATQPPGKGDAGNVNVKVSGLVDIAGVRNGLSSAIFSSVETGTEGNGGNIAIGAGSFQLRDGAGLSASTFGEGNAGSVKITATDAVSLTGAYIFSTVEAGGVGKGGDIDIDAASLSLIDGAQLLTITRRASDTQPPGKGDAGNVNVKVSGVVDIAGKKDTFPSGIFSTVGIGAEGNGGNITIGAGSFQLRDGAQLAASTFGEGNAGSVKITATDAISLTDGDIFSNIGRGGVGSSGGINIRGSSLSLTDGAQLQSGISGSNTEEIGGQGNSGNIDINVTGAVNISGRKGGSGNPSAIFTDVENGARGNGGNINISSGSFFLSDGAQLVASTAGKGLESPNSQAGNVVLTATDAIFLTGANIFSTVRAGGVGKGGNIDINAASLSLTDGAQLLTITRGASDTQPPGKGDAGNVNVKVSGVVDIAGVKNGFSSAIFSNVGTGAEGNGGNITIGAGSFQLRDGAQLTASTFGQGNAGSVKITATDAVSLTDAKIFSNIGRGGVGSSGGINIRGSSLSLTDGAQLQSGINGSNAEEPGGQGNSGNIDINVTGAVTISGTNGKLPSAIFTDVEEGARGNGGNINISSGSFFLSDGARLVASTAGKGLESPYSQAGNITVTTKDAVSLTDADIFSTVRAGGVGKGGNIDINAASLSLTDEAELNTSTRGQGNAGSVKITATDAVSLTGAYIFSTVEAGGVGKGGNIDIDAASLSLTDGAQLLTITRGASDTQPPGKGDAGNVNVKVSGVVDIAGVKNGLSSAIFSRVQPGTEGNGGNITINSNSFKVRDGALLDAGTFNNNRGGDITITANVVEALNGGQLTTTTSGNGSAGKITVNAKDRVTISANDPNYNDRLANFPNRIGNIGANSGFFVSSTGAGVTGDIEVNSPRITLDNQGKLNAESASGNGGNINLNSDVLLLRRGGEISATAGTAQSGGDGGNINLNTKFIVAVPKENSDILANAFTGTGGNINIQAQNLFGIEARPKPTEQSDITASSERGLQGQISIRKPDVDSNRVLIQSPEAFKDKSDEIDQLCGRGKKPLGEFIITGKQGTLPTNPVINLMQGGADFSELATLNETNFTEKVNSIPDRLMVQKTTPNRIVEAQAIVRDADGTLHLVAEAPSVTPNSRPAVSACADVGSN